MRLLAALAVLSVALAACGGDDREQVSHLMTELRQVQDSGDAEKACEEVYVVRERGRDESDEEKGEESDKDSGEGCRDAFEAAATANGVQGLRTRLVRVELEGEEGTAVLHTTATRPDGSELDRDVPYDVVKTEEGWRVRIAGEG